MLTIVVSCVITAGLSFTPITPWRVQKIEGPRPSNALAICWSYPCPKQELAEEDTARFVLEATLTEAEQLEVPAGCTLKSLKHGQ